MVLFTYKLINDRVTHNEVVSKVELRNWEFSPIRFTQLADS